jgi:hypothetical protein
MHGSPSIVWDLNGSYIELNVKCEERGKCTQIVFSIAI